MGARLTGNVEGNRLVLTIEQGEPRLGEPEHSVSSLGLEQNYGIRNTYASVKLESASSTRPRRTTP